MDILRREEYGVSPFPPQNVSGEILSTNPICCSGHTVLQRISVSFDTDNGSFSFPFNLFLPNSETPVPVFVLLNFRPDEYDSYYPAEEIIDNGFALAVIHYNDITADTPDMIIRFYAMRKYNGGIF